MREDRGRVAGPFRAVALSWFAVALSAGAHLVAHGEHPSLPVMVGMLGFVAFCLLPVSLAPFALLPTFVASLVAQALVHVGLSITAMSEAVGTAVAPQFAGHVQHVVGGALAQHGSGVAEHAVGGSMLPTPTMAGFHLVAAGLLAVFLTHVECALGVVVALSAQVWRVVAAVLAAAIGVLVPLVDRLPRARGSRWAVARPRDVWLPPCAGPRGPPALVR